MWPAQPAQKTARPQAAAARSAAQTDSGTTKRKALGLSAQCDEREGVDLWPAPAMQRVGITGGARAL